MSKKYVRYYIVTKEGATEYRKAESDLPFSIDEGKEAIKQNNHQSKTIKHIAKSKAELFLILK